MKAPGNEASFACTVGYDAEVPCVIMTWKGYATSREFREANERILGVLAERKASKLLGDIKEFVLIGADDQHWLSNNWIPRATEAGLRTVAMITPVFYFNRVAVESVGQKLDPEALILQHFETRDAACQWLALIAAHKTGRKARVIEFDPLYCDRIVRRFEKLTGKGARLAGSDQTFETVEAERLGQPAATTTMEGTL